MSPSATAASELYLAWAPPGSIWSQWAKPALFARTHPNLPATANVEVAPLSFVIDQPRVTAVVVDLKRAESISMGLSLARNGFRPVPLFNCVPGPSAVLNLSPMLDMLANSAEVVRGLDLPPNAPPAFLLDSSRMLPDSQLLPGNFDNRYLIFPQDFPSAAFLKAQGIERVLLIKKTLDTEVREDLAHVLLRWQQAGLPIFAIGTDTPTETKQIDVPRPPRFRSLFHRVLALAGLRRNSAGGFGAVIPQPSSGG